MIAAGMILALMIGASPQAKAGLQPLVLDRETAMWLVTLPIGCVDKLHDPPKRTGYLYESTFELDPNFAKSRAFYGCSDWHSAVNSTWTMVKVLKAFPDIAVGRLIRDKLNEHITKDTIKGEIDFFSQEGNKSFERPYGWAWLLRLYGELKSWPDKDAQKWAADLEPLAKLLLDRTVPYLKTLAAPMRVGTHANTAYSLRLLIEYARATNEKTLEAAALDRANAFFLKDEGCAPNVEVSGSDFFSPCLNEAALMATVLPPARFSDWLTKFMPAPDGPAFRALTTSPEMTGTNEDLEKANMLGAKAHLVGLAVSRARAMQEIANGLPPSDPRVSAYRRIADEQARSSIDAMYEADYAGTHWIATYIVDYLLSAHRSSSTD